MASNSHRNALQPGYMVHWYRIQRILGQGGFGITYLAEDTNLSQQVAVKEYLPIEVAVREGDYSVHPVSENHSESFNWGLERFVDEARTLARFDHPNIVRVLSVFEMNNTAYMVMRYEHGRSLQQLLRKRATIEEGRLTEMLYPILDGLERVHAAGFIHRDVKPANIFIREDTTPVLLDFGSARQSLGQATRTLTTLVSPGYAPFEQYFSKSDRQGPWTDIYGLGATFYRAVTGVAPMNAVDRSEGIINRGRDPLPPAVEAAADLYSPHLLQAIDWAISFQEEARPQNIGEWRRALKGEAAVSSAPSRGDEAPTVASVTGAPGTSSMDLLLEPTAGTKPLKTKVQKPDVRSKKGKRYWVAGLAALLLVFMMLNAGQQNPGEGQAQAVTAPETTPVIATAPKTAQNEADIEGVTDGAENAPAASDTPPASEENEEEFTGGRSTEKIAFTDTAPSPAPSKESRVAALLDEAEADIDQLRLSTPPGNNALEKYRQILFLDPHNADARAGVKKIVETYAELGKEAAKDKDYDRASFFIDQALAIAPNSRPLKRAHRRLKRLKRRQK